MKPTVSSPSRAPPTQWPIIIPSPHVIPPLPQACLSRQWLHGVIIVQLEQRAGAEGLLLNGKDPLFQKNPCSCSRKAGRQRDKSLSVLYCILNWPTLHQVPGHQRERKLIWSSLTQGGWLLLAAASCYCRGALSSAPMSRSATVTDAWLHHLRSVFLRLERSAQP